jgi:hypothetical protein
VTGEKDEALFKIAVDALHAIQRSLSSMRHQDQLGRAITALHQCREDICNEIDRLRPLPQRAPQAGEKQ